MTHSQLEKEIKKILKPYAISHEAKAYYGKGEIFTQLLTLIDKHTQEYVEEILPEEKGIIGYNYWEIKGFNKGYNQALSDIRKKEK